MLWTQAFDPIDNRVSYYQRAAEIAGVERTSVSDVVTFQ